MTVVPHALTSLTRTVVVAVALAVTAAGLVLAGTTTASASGTSSDSTSSARLAMSSDSYESRVQHYINRKRAAHGLRALRFERCTDGVAEAWAANLATTGGFFHQDTAHILNVCHARYAGETLGRGGYSPKALVKAWMRSPYHRPILLSRHAKRIGIGANFVGGQWVTAANFTRL